MRATREERPNGLVADAELGGQLTQRAAAAAGTNRRLLPRRKLAPARGVVGVPLGPPDWLPLRRVSEDDRVNRQDAPAEPTPVASAGAFFPVLVDRTGKVLKEARSSRRGTTATAVRLLTTTLANG